MSINKIFALLLSLSISLIPLSVTATSKKTDGKLPAKETKRQIKINKAATEKTQLKVSQSIEQAKSTKRSKKTETQAIVKENKGNSVKKIEEKVRSKSKQAKKSETKILTKENKRISTKKTEEKLQSKVAKQAKTNKTEKKLKGKNIKDKSVGKDVNHQKKKKGKNYGVKGAKLVPTKVMDKKYRYREKGKNHITIGKEASRLYSQTGVASYYGGMFHGRKTANGEIFNKNAFTAAHKTLALGSYALVTNLRNGRKVIVKINDRGPFSKNRIIDLSVAAAREIGMIHSGVARVKVEAMQVDRYGYVSGKGAESLLKLAKKSGLNLKVKGDGKHLSIKAE